MEEEPAKVHQFQPHRLQGLRLRLQSHRLQGLRLQGQGHRRQGFQLKPCLR